MERVYDSIVKKEPINKGYSKDKKFIASTKDGTCYLLRISPMSLYENRELLFSMLKQVEALGIPMCLPVEFGVCESGVYSIQSWICGDDLESVLPKLSPSEQYKFGKKAGEMLLKIHTITSPNTQKGWDVHFSKVAGENIKLYQDYESKIEGYEHFVDYIQQNLHLLRNRPQCFHHGDFYTGNMMTKDGDLIIIDFDRYAFGDPWKEFDRVVWSARTSDYFATGQINRYFNEEPPLEFFKLLNLYVASTMLSYVSWGVPFKQSWLENMSNPFPAWYLRDFAK